MQKDEKKLSRSLQSRHIQMIAIGGASEPVYFLVPGVPSRHPARPLFWRT